MSTEELIKSTLKLNIIDRIHLTEILLESLDKTDEQIEKIWVEESENRYKAYKEGHIKSISLKNLRSRIKN